MDRHHSYLVLWQTAEADSWQGQTPRGSVGTHMKDLVDGDIIFISACDAKELYLLGALRISRTGIKRSGRWKGKPNAEGKTLAGAFQFLPLREQKWKLRFERTRQPKLAKSKSLLWQVRSRRRLAAASAKLLLDILKQGKKQAVQINRIFRQEGSVRMRAMLQRERDPAVRRAALRHYGHKCLTCAFDPVRTYGPWAKDCLEVHHLNPLSVRYRKRARTTLRDVVVVCPTCHRALHAFPPGPAAWRRLKWLLSAEMAS